MTQHHEEEALDKSYDARLMRRLIQYLKPYQLQVLAAMLLIGVASLMQVSSPYLTKIGIDNYIIHKDQAGLNRIVLIYLGIVAFGFFLVDIRDLPFDSNSTKVGVSCHTDTNGML